MLRKAYLEISNICNLSCSFCPGTGREPRVMSAAEFRLLAEKLRGHTEYLYFHLMGEPLLHPELGRLLEIAGESFSRDDYHERDAAAGAGEILLCLPGAAQGEPLLPVLRGQPGGRPVSASSGCINFQEAGGEKGCLRVPPVEEPGWPRMR